MIKYWVYQYDEGQQGYVPAGGNYTDREEQALSYCEGRADCAVYRYDHSALVPTLIPSPKLANGSFLDDLRNGRYGRPSQGRKERVQAHITPEQMRWLEAQKVQHNETVSDVLFRLIREAMEEQSSCK